MIVSCLLSPRVVTLSFKSLFFADALTPFGYIMVYIGEIPAVRFLKRNFGVSIFIGDCYLELGPI